ncbi:hypothetical protein BW727_100935 [Jeotgalibaca dankookensis]|uniref:Phosphoesterase n=1 Tax=Jeotgalibaca dankookensis TaxID=708126 RepID=A0A1S6IP47_9LACT|nr:metallophosphoesterase [Jeotgalibaca dankookensis]AQS53327.1 hypothetical protein BW727_100935 [Jeotgalibaca dankookensis]
MQLLLVSDSHGDSQILDELVEKYVEEVDAFVHCGDSELSSAYPVWNIVDTVAGNCDFDNGFQDVIVRRNLEYDYAIVHGHYHNIKWSLDPLKELAQEERVSMVFYGHSHVLKFDYTEGVFFINPGSITQPRGELKERTYCILSAHANQLMIDVYNHEHEKLDYLSFKSNKLSEI